jgi:hypothetical protein
MATGYDRLYEQQAREDELRRVLNRCMKRRATMEENTPWPIDPVVPQEHHNQFAVSRVDSFMLGFVLATVTWAFFAYCIRIGL